MITGYSSTRIGNAVQVTAISNLVTPGGPTVYFFWYQDGAYVGVSTDASWTFILDTGQQSVITAIDSTNPNFAATANAPAGWPAQRSLQWVRSLDSSIGSYRVEQQENGGSWSAIATVQDDPTRWLFQVVSGTLDDLSTYAWRVVPVDAFGNDGTILTLGAELIVRTPNAPKFAISLNGSQQMTFTSA